ncbi:MAG: oligopeptide:H+ symporter, partial [Bryobacteraceae bacterium]|nr:oligopeptide:H+ symporter [Bryobacteraceae bacterium]
MQEAKGSSLEQPKGFFGHPRGLATLFLTEVWERFSYYGMRALLILYMTAATSSGGLGFDVAKAGALYGLYTAMVYLLSLPGGWIADRFLGQRRAVLYGGALIALGNSCLAMPPLALFYVGLTISAVGTGLLKPNVSVMVGQLYETGDRRRDAGFSIFYMGINLGAFLAPLATGWLAQSEQFRRTLAGWGFAPEGSWHWGFAAAAVGMFLGLCQYVLGGRALGDAGKAPGGSATPAHLAAAWRKFGMGAGLVFALIAVVAVLSAGGTIVLTAEVIGRVFDWVLVLTVLGFFGWLFLGKGWSAEERKRLLVIFVLFLGAAVFWSAFEQAGSTLNLFAERSTRTRVLGFDFPASWFQSLNPLFIILLAPVFAWLWVALGRRDPSSPAKFALGLFLLALG